MPHNRDAPLLRSEPLGGAYVLVTFRHAEVSHQAQPGQFVMIKPGTTADVPLRRPFSILRTEPGEDSFTLFVKSVGSGSRAIADMRPGELAQCLGPLGNPFPMDTAGAEPVMVAGGYGIAPFRLWSERARALGVTPRLFYGGRTKGDLKLWETFEPLGVPVTCTTDDGSFGHHGRVTEPLEAYLDRAPGPVQLLACGPEGMMHAVAQLAARRRLPAWVSLDPWMGCGIGTCLGCVVRTQKAGEAKPKYRCGCTDGPVFDATEIVWWGASASLAAAR